MPEDQIQAQIPAVPAANINEAVQLSPQSTEAVAEAAHQEVQVPDDLADVLKPTKQPTLREISQAEPLAQVHPPAVVDINGEKITYPKGIVDIAQARELREKGKSDDAMAYAATIVLREEERVA